MASLDDFKKLDIRVAQVKRVEDHPNADRLYVVTVDAGDGERTIVAGIKKYYKKEALIGKNILVIVNLEPAVIRGITSNGMLLAARDSESPVLVGPERSVAPGSVIS